MSTKSNCRPDRCPHEPSDEELLERLLALNLERASVGKVADPQNAGSGDDRLVPSLPT